LEAEPVDEPVVDAEPVVVADGVDEPAPADEPVVVADHAEPTVVADHVSDVDHADPAGLPDDRQPADDSGAEPAVPENPNLTLTDPTDDVPPVTAGAGVQAEPVRLPLEALRPVLEAIMLVVDEPVAEELLAQVLERPRDEVVAGLEALSAEYTAAGRGFDLRRAAGGWRLYTREEFAPYVERFVLDGQQARLTQAALETLAVVAYKQPVTRSRISAIRGVAVDGVIRTLLTRGMIEECGAEPDTGAHLYRTTTLFLEKLGLDSIDELPALAPLLPDLDTLDDVIAAS
jgi:segregation and condensation protein B